MLRARFAEVGLVIVHSLEADGLAIVFAVFERRCGPEFLLLSLLESRNVIPSPTGLCGGSYESSE